MPYEKVTIDDVNRMGPPDENIPPGADAGTAAAARVLTPHLGVEGFSINHYTVAPGESFTISTHRHEVQEELFYVTSGVATFRVGGGPDVEGEPETVDVEAGEVIRIAPGTFQLGTNEGEATVEALALGAPQEYEAVTEWVLPCENCGERTVHVFGPANPEAEDPEEFVYECTACGAETYRISTPK